MPTSTKEDELLVEELLTSQSFSIEEAEKILHKLVAQQIAADSLKKNQKPLEP